MVKDPGNNYNLPPLSSITVRGPVGNTGSTRPSLLLVDDEQAFADTLAFRLETAGIPAHVVYRADAALHLLDRPELEVILLDVNLPGLSGLEALRQIKDKRPDVEVILLTGEADFTTAATGMRRGAGDYLLKPVDFTVLLASINKARQRSSEHKARLRAAEAGKLMALGALAAGVGHEINNPLQVILQHAEWLHELLGDAREGQLDLQEMELTAIKIQQQARRIGAMTARLLELAHQSRQGSVETAPAELIERVLSLQHERIATMDVQVKLELAEDLPLLPCSPAELEPVLTHLLQNALDAIDARQKKEGTCEARITIRAELAQGAQVGEAAESAEPMLRLTVADTGEGIAPEYAARIFEPFFSTRPMGHGPGLGLTVCHSIIAALHGRISQVNATLGLPPKDGPETSPGVAQGAAFVIELPVAPTRAESPDCAIKR